MAVNGPVANPRAPPCSGRARRAWARDLPGKPVPLIEQVNADRTPVEITSRRGDAVLMSRADYALEETAHCASRRTPVTFWRAFDRPRPGQRDEHDLFGQSRDYRRHVAGGEVGQVGQGHPWQVGARSLLREVSTRWHGSVESDPSTLTLHAVRLLGFADPLRIAGRFMQEIEADAGTAARLRGPRVGQPLRVRR